MTRRSTMSIGALAIAFFAGCTTAVMEGRSALRQGHYEDAATRFTQALARDPGWLDALIGLGVAKYKLAEYDEAIDALERVVAREPRQATAHLYLALSHFRRGEYGPAEEHLKAVSELTPSLRTAAQIDRALRLMRDNDPLSDDMRAFVAASLENETELEREVRERDIALRNAEIQRSTWAPTYIICRSRRC
jgi:tetratricopeptide (TPR) repeat protein